MDKKRNHFVLYGDGEIGEPKPEDGERVVWGGIGDAFSRPVMRGRGISIMCQLRYWRRHFAIMAMTRSFIKAFFGNGKI
jgi:hypothetical protein